MKIIPKCKNDLEHYVTAEGYWVPCCNVPQYGSEYKNSELYNEVFKIERLEDIYRCHKEPVFLKWIEKIESGVVPAPIYCKRKCSDIVTDIESSETDKRIIANGQEQQEL